MLEELKKLLEEKHVQAVNILHSAARTCKCGQHEKNKKDNRQLYHWIYEQTSFLDERYGLAQRIHWIINGLKEFPSCIECGHAIDDPKQFKTIFTGYKDFCCPACGREHAKKANKETRLKKNNGKYFSDESIQKAKKTFIEHYGVDNNMKSDKGKKEHAAAIEKKYGKGVKNAFQADEVKSKSKMAKLKKYGDANWNNQSKNRQTKKQRYGDEFFTNRKKAKQTCLERYGVDHHSKVLDIHQKTVMNRKHHCYFIDGHSFDSIPEFCFYVCCRDFGIQIQCHPIGKALEYKDMAGKSHMYYPDFYLPSMNQIVEVKGDQFFKDRDESKEMTNRFGEHDITGRAEAKHRCMLDNNVMILTSRR